MKYQSCEKIHEGYIDSVTECYSDDGIEVEDPQQALQRPEVDNTQFIQELEIT